MRQSPAASVAPATAGATDAARICLASDRPYVDGLRTLLALGDLELDRLVFNQVVDARGERVDVHEDVLALRLLDEAVALLAVEPLYFALSQPVLLVS